MAVSPITWKNVNSQIDSSTISSINEINQSIVDSFGKFGQSIADYSDSRKEAAADQMTAELLASDNKPATVSNILNKYSQAAFAPSAEALIDARINSMDLATSQQEYDSYVREEPGNILEEKNRLLGAEAENRRLTRQAAVNAFRDELATDTRNIQNDLNVLDINPIETFNALRNEYIQEGKVPVEVINEAFSPIFDNYLTAPEFSEGIRGLPQVESLIGKTAPGAEGYTTEDLKDVKKAVRNRARQLYPNSPKLRNQYESKAFAGELKDLDERNFNQQTASVNAAKQIISDVNAANPAAVGKVTIEAVSDSTGVPVDDLRSNPWFGDSQFTNTKNALDSAVTALGLTGSKENDYIANEFTKSAIKLLLADSTFMNSIETTRGWLNDYVDSFTGKFNAKDAAIMFQAVTGKTVEDYRTSILSAKSRALNTPTKVFK